MPPVASARGRGEMLGGKPKPAPDSARDAKQVPQEARKESVARRKSTEEESAAHESDGSANVFERRIAPASSPYLAALGQLARELDAQGKGRGDLAAIRLLRQRLVEWVEDLRSVGDAPEVADAVERLVLRLSSALAANNAAAEAVAVAAELLQLAAGAAPPPKPSGRAAFWK